MQETHTFTLAALPGVEFTVTHDTITGWLSIDGQAADESVTVGAGWHVQSPVS